MPVPRTGAPAPRHAAHRPSERTPARALPLLTAAALALGVSSVVGSGAVAADHATQGPVRWDVGSAGATWDGVAWTGDPVGTSGTMRQTAAPGLYGTVREGMTRFEVPVVPGRYDVRVHLLDPDSTAKGQRVVDVVAEGVTERDDLDVFRKVGRLRPWIESFRSTVRDGALTIDLPSSAGRAVVAAVEVVPHDWTPLTTPAPTTPAPTTPAPTTPAPTTPAPTTPAPTTPAPTTPAPSCAGGAVVTVSTAAQLTAALAAAGPGTTVQLAPGTYAGRFVLTRSGSATAPLRVCGPTSAVLDGGSTSSGYGLHLDGVSHVQVHGLSVRNAQKGIMVDRSTRVVVSGTVVERIGDEGIHLRRNTTDSLVTGTTVRDTGLRTAAYGEGIYIGSAKSNWASLTGGQPDRSDRNRVERNTISRTTSEAVDIKEGTTGGWLVGNSFDGAATTAADSWVDVKGNDWQVTDNVGRTAPQDGFQTHEILAGWGQRTLFARNVATVGGPGYGVYVHRPLGTVVRCDNVVSGAARGLSNIPCT